MTTTMTDEQHDEQNEAEFFNQTPRFEAELRSFRIDLDPVSDVGGEIVRGLTYSEAESHCAERGARLPTEFEWEAAAIDGAIRVEDGLLEWTASWYEAYPGNSKTEAEFGRRFRVLRGSPSGSELDPHDRRFLAPGQQNSQVGFRCVEEVD